MLRNVYISISYEDYLNDRIVPLLPYNEVNPEDEETDNLCQNEEQQAQNETMLVSVSFYLNTYCKVIHLHRYLKQFCSNLGETDNLFYIKLD